ncbi:MAG: MEDS domain-containing protein [Methanomicrobiales archaeon]
MSTDQIMGSIEDLQMGDHLCCLYETEKEHKNILTPYIIQGLENNEKIVYILDKHTKNTVKTYIQDMDLDANSLIESGQFVFLSTGESYILDGHFHPDSMITLLQNSLDVALQEGYSALRVTGEMSWILKGLKGSEKFIEYESKLNQFFPGKKCIGLCQYNLTDFNNNLLLDVLLTHPKVALADKIYKNIYYIPTSQYHANNLPYSTFETWIKNLKNQAKYEDILTLSEKRYRNLFENSPISLWEEDFSQVKSFIEQLKEDSVDDFREYFENNPDIVNI